MPAILDKFLGFHDAQRKRRRSTAFFRPRLENLELRTMLAAGLSISEFMADNHRNLQDFDDDWSDWIEVLNDSAASIDLKDYYLTDNAANLTQWQVPVETLIGPGETLVVFASGKDFVAPKGELHTSFGLNSSGEYLALVKPDGLTIAWEFNSPLPDDQLGFPQQYEDVSYGLAMTATGAGIAEPTAARYFDVPTPGAANEGGAPHAAVPPGFSRVGGTFTDNFLLELTTDIPDATIHFTTNKTLPTLDSNTYDPLQPISITTATQVRAIVVAPDHIASQVATHSYVKLAADVQQFSSQLPVVILDNFQGGAIEGSDKATYWAIFEPQEVDGLTSLLGTPELQTRAGIRIRGTSSANFPKKAFSIEAWDEKNQDKNISPLGLPADSDWILNAYYLDRALSRNSFMFELSNQMGRYAVRNRFVEVFVNTDGGELQRSDYVGVHVFMEKIKRGNDRVDVEKLSKNYDTGPLINGGYIFKFDRSDPGDNGFVAGGTSIKYVDPKEVEIKSSQRQAQRDFIKNYIDDFADSLGNPAPETGFPSYIDVDSWIDYHLQNSLALDRETLKLSTYFFKTRDGKLEFGPIWDNDRSLGNDDVGEPTNVDPIGWPQERTQLFDAPWWSMLFEHADFRQKFVDRYQELREGLWHTSNMDAILFSLAAQLTDDAAGRNFERWKDVRPNSGTPPSWLGEVEALRSWVEQRVSWLDGQFVPMPILAPTPDTQPPTPGGLPPGSLAFDFGPPDSPVAEGFIPVGGDAFEPDLGYGWTSGLANPFDRGAGGELRADFAEVTPRSGIFSVDLDNGRYDVTLVAGDHDQDRDEMLFRFEPDTPNETGDLVSTTQGRFLEKTYEFEVEDGRFDLELSDLGGVSAQAIINALVITPADSQEGVFPIGSTFTLSLPPGAPEGTTLYYTVDGSDPRISLIDGASLTSNMERDFNTTRQGTFVVDLPNGTYDVTVHQGDLNRARDQGVITLEDQRANPEPIDTPLGTVVENTFQVDVADGQLALLLEDLGGDTGSFPINGLEIQGVGSAEHHLFDFGRVISPVEPGYTHVHNDLMYSPEEGFGWQSGKINAQLRTVLSEAGAFAPSAIEYQGEPIAITAPTTIRARAFLPDSTLILGPKPTHTIQWSGIAQQTFNIETPQLAITEINFNPVEPSNQELAVDPNFSAGDFEFIELKNLGASPVNLNNYRLSNGVDFTFPNATLEAGQYALIVKDQPAFQARYGEFANILGEYSRSLSNAGEGLTLLDAEGDIALDFNYDDNDPWHIRTDGDGASLELIDPAATPAEQLGKSYQWRASSPFHGSPGEAGADPIGVVINEVFSSGPDPQSQPDAIELLNSTDHSIDIGGWFLSDSAGNLLKYEIPADTTLPAGGYLVFTALQFNPTPNAPQPKHFGLSSTNGDDVWLVQADASGNVTLFADDVHFGPAAPGESFGRTPDGQGRLAPMKSVTLGGANSNARVGPLVFSEINYHPSEPTAEALAIHPELVSSDLEFFEFLNPTGDTVELADWQVRGGIEYDFDDGTTIGPGETLVVIRFNPDNPANVNRLAAFRKFYDLEETVTLLGGYTGSLSNSQDLLRLLRPGDPPPEDPSNIPHFLEDEVLYDDLPPWPTAADGTGASLNRTVLQGYGNQPANWTAEDPTPTLALLTTLGDLDHDDDIDFDDIDDFLLGLDDPALYEATYGVPATARGDINGDGDLDRDDIPGFVSLLSGGGPAPQASAKNVGGNEPENQPFALALRNPAVYAQSFDTPATAAWDSDHDGDVDFDDIRISVTMPDEQLVKRTDRTAALSQSSRDSQGQRHDPYSIWPGLVDRVLTDLGDGIR